MAKAKRRAKPREPEDDSLGFTTANYVAFGVGIITIIVGFITLKLGSITIAPILLVLGYCVIIPLSIIINWKRPKKGESGDNSAAAGV